MWYSDFGRFLFDTGLRRAIEAGANGHKTVLFVDYCRVADKYPFLQDLAVALDPLRLAVLDGRRGADGDTALSPALFLSTPPNVYYREDWQTGPVSGQEIGTALRLPDSVAETFAALNRNHFRSVDTNIIRECVDTAFFYALTVIRMLDPAIVMVWNAFHPLSQCAIRAAETCGKPVLFAEYGLLPGTMNVDAAGQMGASVIARDPERFNRLPLTATMRQDARRATLFLKTSGLNRRAQPDAGKLGRRIEAAARGRPKILFAGHNDFASGVMPWDDTARAHHSPLFSGSHAAARHLAEIARQRNWLLVVKPHPFTLGTFPRDFDANTLVLGDDCINACIDACDAVVTVLSQVSYVAMIRDRPVVMLGRNPLNGSGAVRVAHEMEAIGPEIEAALASGISDDQRDRWLDHVARLLNYYLVRWNPDVPREVAALPVGALAAHIRTMVETGRPTDLPDTLASLPRRGEATHA